MDNLNYSTFCLSANPEFNFLNKILDISDNEHELDFNDSPYETTNITCEYIDSTSYASTFKNLYEIFLMYFNVQSLSAKFSKFKDMIQFLMDANCAPDVICLQEIWQIPTHADFSLNGDSNLEYKTRSNNVQGGGVGIYVRSNIPYTVSNVYSVFYDRLFESLFVELVINLSKLLVGSVYRPNVNHPNLTQTDQLA